MPPQTTAITGVQIAFFAVRETVDKQGFLGAILVLDEAGVPREFRCTHPVRPTQTQKALYGNSLERFVQTELSGKPLIGALNNTPKACLVEAPGLVVLRELVNIPVFCVQRLGDAMVTKGPEKAQPRPGENVSSGMKRLDDDNGRYQPLAVHSCKGFETDLDQAGDALRTVFQRVDLVEPFERITTALRVLGERDERFR